MKKTLHVIVLLGSISLFSYCTPFLGKKSEKVTVVQSPEVVAEAFTDADFTQGRKLMEAKCGDCHVLFEPIDFNAKDWDEILKSMLPKSKLTGKDAALVKHYIISNAKKA